VVRAFHEATSAPVPRIALPSLPAATGAIDALPAPAGAVALGEALGVDEVWAAAIAIDRGRPTMVVRRLRGNGCATGLYTASAPTFDAAARRATQELRSAPETCPGEPVSLIEAELIARPRPAEAAAAASARRRPLKTWEQPWLWAGVIAGAAVVVGLAVGLAPHASAVRVDVDGTQFSSGR
jgi:hypothetical protein